MRVRVCAYPRLRAGARVQVRQGLCRGVPVAWRVRACPVLKRRLSPGPQRPPLHPGLPPEHLRRGAGRESPQPHPRQRHQGLRDGPQEVPRLDRAEDLPGEPAPLLPRLSCGPGGPGWAQLGLFGVRLTHAGALSRALAQPHLWPRWVFLELLRAVSIECPVTPDRGAVGATLAETLEDRGSLAGRPVWPLGFCPDPHPGKGGEEGLLYPPGHLLKRHGSTGLLVAYVGVTLARVSGSGASAPAWLPGGPQDR